MNTINWTNEVEARKDTLVKRTQELLRIPSVLDESTRSKKQPFGVEIDQALTYMLDRGKDYEFSVKNLDGYAGVIEHGQGEECVGVLIHLDVVPAGEGWTTPPFSAEIRHGRLYARGAIDNKGPAMAAFFALTIVKELGLPLKKRVRIILGTDEESEWRCVDHYFKHDEMPTIGFAPDADFPIIHAEKGIADVVFTWPTNVGSEQPSALILTNFHAGERLNMVPDKATATIISESDELIKVKKKFEQYLNEKKYTGATEVSENTLMLTCEGISVHGSTPEKGINAGTLLSSFLAGLSLQQIANKYFLFITEYLHLDTVGKSLEIASDDSISGKLTVNAGAFTFDQEKASIGLNIRYPVTASGEECFNQLRQVAKLNEANFVIQDHMTPSYVEADHPLIHTLQSVYARQTGQEATLLSSGGATYARSMQTGVAFGAVFPGREDVAHQKDEYIDIQDLLKATAIYAEAIYELAK